MRLVNAPNKLNGAVPCEGKIGIPSTNSKVSAIRALVGDQECAVVDLWCRNPAHPEPVAATRTRQLAVCLGYAELVDPLVEVCWKGYLVSIKSQSTLLQCPASVGN